MLKDLKTMPVDRELFVIWSNVMNNGRELPEIRDLKIDDGERL